jgi:hypothetical protein
MPSAPVSLQPLADYTAPALPTEESLRRFYLRTRAVLLREAEAPFIATDRLEKTGGDLLDAIAPAPACGPFGRDMDAALTEWSAASTSSLRLIVLPPCDENGLIEGWAGRHGHTLVHPPLPSDLISADGPVNSPLGPIDPAGNGILVIPRLEEWFLRHRDGLHHVHHLLDWLSRLERSCLVACDAWAWAFLCKAANAHMVLPEPVTGQPFDAARLRAWFLELAPEQGEESFTFRLSTTGDDVFALDEDGNRCTEYFDTLAARSRGIPWVAWNLWRRSLRSGLQDERGTDDQADNSRIPGEATLWITDPPEQVVPETPDNVALFVLHALLIHGSLDADELAAVLPMDSRSTILSALVKAGVVSHGNGRYACMAAAYPVIRDSLASAGFPMGAI